MGIYNRKTMKVRVLISLQSLKFSKSELGCNNKQDKKVLKDTMLL